MVVLLYFSFVLLTFATPLLPGPKGQVSTIDLGLTQTWTFSSDEYFEVDVWRTSSYIGLSRLNQPSVSFKLQSNNQVLRTSSGQMYYSPTRNTNFTISITSNIKYSYLVRWCYYSCPDSCPVIYNEYCNNEGACINNTCVCDKVANSTYTTVDCTYIPDLGPLSGLIIWIAVIIVLVFCCVVCITVILCCVGATSVAALFAAMIAGLVACCASCGKKEVVVITTTQQDANRQYQPVATHVPVNYSSV